MPRISFELDTVLDFTIQNDCGQDTSAQELGLAFELAAGQGPLEFTISPKPSFRFSLDKIMCSLAKILKIDALAKVSQVTNQKPWSLIFQTEIEPTLKVLVSNTNSVVQCTLTLYNQGSSTPGITLGGVYGPITIEPIFTVFELIISYDKSKGGFGLNARVQFEKQQDTQQLLLKGTLSEDGPQKKTSVVKFPFPVPGQGSSLFTLKYLGLGQRFGPPLPTNPNDFSSALSTIFSELTANLSSNNPEEVVSLVSKYYHPDRGWFIAADVEFKGWEVRLLFNDPVLYGLEVTCNADRFKGLDLIILYVKLGPHLGVYYGKLTIPEAYRQVNLGAVALTLPTIQIWIYTNGDFKVNVGWPIGDDSIGIEVYIFTGGGGFYFGKLRSGDNPQNPSPVNYNPILLFGLGIWFGVGRSIRKGPFSASLSLTLQGTFQGILAWNEALPANNPNISRAPDYFWFAATVGMVGTLQGEVDLKIIKLSVLVRLSLTAGVAFETDYNTIVYVEATVKVEASVKILFVKITVGFHATISHTFVLSQGGLGDASLNGPQNPAFKGLNGGGSGDSLDSLVRARQPRSRLAAVAIPAIEAPVVLQLNFLLYPAVVYDQASGNGPQAIAILALSNESDGELPSDWQKLMNAFAAWLLTTYSQGTAEWATVVEQLNANGSEPPTGFDTLLVDDFLANNVEWSIVGVDLTQVQETSQDMVFFPVMPNLEMTSGDTVVHFSEPLVAVDYLQYIQNYFAQFTVSALMSNASEAVAGVLRAMASPEASLNGLLFTDYFLMAARQLAQQMADETPESTEPLPAIANNVAGFVSRFLLHGLVVPTDVGSTDFNGLYEFTGQQFAVDSAQSTATATLAKDAGYQPISGQPDFSKLNITITTADAIIPLAVPPATPPAFPGNPVLLPPLTSLPLWVASRNRLPWEATGQVGQYIAPLPNRVQSLLDQQPLKLVVQGEYPHPGQTGAPIAAAPGLLINIKLSQVKQPKTFNVNDEGDAKPSYLPFIYLIGTTDDETRDLIETALKGVDFSNATIQLLYNSSTNGYQSDVQNPAATFLVKTNLSTTSEPDSLAASFQFMRLAAAANDPLGPVWALQSNISDFLRIIWENSVVNAGGFYLYYNNADGKDLPESIFAEGEADLQVLVSQPQGSLFQPWHNVFVIPSEGINDSLYVGVNDASGNPVNDYQPSYPTGCIAFELTSPLDLAADTDNGENQPYSAETLAQLYQLIQFQIPADAASGVNASGWSPAISPTQEGANSLGAISPLQAPPELPSGPDSYRQVIPVYNFVDGNAPIAPGLLPNNYAAVGKTSALQFRLADIYGNTLGQAPGAPTFTVLYNDNLWSPAEWPGIQINYRIFADATTNNQPVLGIKFRFQPSLVVRVFANDAYSVDGAPPGQTPGISADELQQAQIALYKLYFIWNQVQDANTHFKVTTSIFPNNGGGNQDAQLRAPLQQIVQQSITELSKIVNNGGTPQSFTQDINLPITPTAITEVQGNVLPLDVWLTIYRDVFLPANVDQMPKIKENTLALKPNLEVSEGETAPPQATLTNFAEDFEAVFKGFDGASGQVKLAVRNGNADFSATTSISYLWAVKWSPSKGFEVKINSGSYSYFTLAPLSNQLLPSESATITTYNEQLNPATSTVVFSQVDVDAFAISFLNAFGELLDPEAAAAIAKVDPTNFANLMQAKANLAAALKEGLIPVFDDGETGDISSAKDRFEQALLNELSSAYGVSAIAQLPVTVTTNATPTGEDQPPRIFGNVEPIAEGDSTDSKAYSLSNCKLELEAPAQYLNILATAKEPADQADIFLDLVYNPVFVEHLVQSDDNAFGYMPSTWLRFVIIGPGTPTQYSLGKANIPIPLRVFPKTPSLQSQSAGQVGNTRERAPGTNPVEEALQWSYTSEVLLGGAAAQDNLWMTLKYNLPVTSLSVDNNALKADNEVPPLINLFRQLAAYNGAYDSFRKYFLEQVNAVVNGGDQATLKQMVGILTPLVQNVAKAYLELMAPSQATAKLGDPPGVIIRNFVLSLKEAFTEKELILFGDTNHMAEYPVTINGQKSTDANPVQVPPDSAPGPALIYMMRYPYVANPAAAGDFTFVWTNIDVIQRQTATTIFWRRRNADLGADGMTVNEKLIYQTPEVTFANPTLPLLNIVKIDTPATAKLVDAIQNIFEPFAQAGSTSTNNRLLRVQVSYSYNLLNFTNPSGRDLSVSKPVLLIPDLHLQPDDSNNGNAITVSAFSQSLAQDLTTWHNANLPVNAPSSLTAALHFSVTLFAVIDDSQLPLINVADIVAPAGSNGWWS